MDFLFDNPLANLYGPYFLIFYVLFIVAVVIGFRIARSNADKTKNFNIPPIPNNPDAFKIAYLRGGENELARTVVFSLAQKNLVRFIHDEKNPQISVTNTDFDRRSLSTIERTAYDWFGGTRNVKELFNTDGLANALKPYAETYRTRLEMQHLMPDEVMKANNNRFSRVAILLFGTLGAYKFLAALYNGHFNVIGIVIITIGGLILLKFAAKMPRLTNLGVEYLKRLQLAFERIKPSNHYPPEMSGAPTFAAIDPFLLSVGVFGGAALAGTMYGDYNRAFERAQTNSGWSSCGSGCGSASSCSSGGGDGGSNCGGGCGGCGGGCGG